MTPAERDRIRAQVRESRRRQGFPAHVQDTSVLDRLAGRLLTDGATRRDQGTRAAPGVTASGAVPAGSSAQM
jgi:hypothetical protein